MPGKPYTLKEMKVIVDYLCEHKAYSKIGGQKMWMDLANSKTLDRTWQSLKETFLKRILPDISNPYYKLSVEQITSFRRKCDVEERNKRKLDVISVSDSHSSDIEKSAQPKSTKNVIKKTGEDKNSNTDDVRSSAETLVLEKCDETENGQNCYETAEDVRKALESPNGGANKIRKSLRDYITYSEPLTPLVQDVLHDFDTDEDEPQLKIVEPEKKITDETDKNRSHSPILVRESQSYNNKTVNKEDNALEKSKIKSLKLKKTHKGTWENKEPVDNNLAVQNNLSNNNSGIIFENDNNDENATQHTGNDATPIPNNQEGLNNNCNDTSDSNHSQLSENKKNKKEKSRKRSLSENSSDVRKKKKTQNVTDNVKQPEQTQTFDSHPQATDLQKDINAIEESVSDNIEIDQNPNNSGEEENNKILKSNVNEGTSQEAGPSNVHNAASNDLNPCLKSVSLFEDNFNQSENNDEKDESPKNNKEDNIKNAESSPKPSTSKVIVNPQNTTAKAKLDEVVLLKSHSESDSEHFQMRKKRRSAGRIKKSRERILSNMFGFSSGAASVKRSISKTKSRSRWTRKRSRNLSNRIESGSSDEYTSASDSDMSTPPQRTSRRIRDHERLQSYDILSHPDGQTLMIKGSKKLYPLLLKKNIKLHYTFCGENGLDSEDQRESYWKEKYMEERKKVLEEKIRADELARLLKHAKESETRNDVRSPVLPISKESTSGQDLKKEAHREKPTVVEEPKTDEMVKIKFSKNKDIEFEVQWSHLNPMFDKIVSMFNNNDTAKSEKISIENAKSNTQTEISRPQSEGENKSTGNDMNVAVNGCPEIENTETNIESVNSKTVKKPPVKKKVLRNTAPKKSGGEDVSEISSGISTPLTIVHERVNQIENEIFKTIEKIEGSDMGQPEGPAETNVTKRKRGRPLKVSTSLSASSVENLNRKSKSPTSNMTSETKAVLKTQTETEAPRRQPKRPRKYESDTGIAESKMRSLSNRSISKMAAPKTRRSLSTRSVNKIAMGEVVIPEDDPNVKYKFPPRSPSRNAKRTYNKSSGSYNTQQIITSPDTASRLCESTQGYQDSDVTPPNIAKRKKKNCGIGLLRKVRRSSPYLADDDTNESNDKLNSKLGGRATAEESVNSEVYRSESYQLLLPKAAIVKELDKIDESPNVCDKDSDILSPLTVNINNEYYVSIHEQDISKKNSEGNSSSISLPLSPELSVVDNLSISKDTISNSSINHPTLNELQASSECNPVLGQNNYKINDIDVSMPLMAQDFALQIYNDNDCVKAKVSELVEMEENSDSLYQKLQDLLLESAKKVSQSQTGGTGNVNPMDVDPIASNKKGRAKKRCSTPRKKQTVLRSKTPEVDPVLEEHTETCSVGSRQSCLPVITVIPPEETVNNNNNNVSNKANDVVTKKGKKKDIIKVKILRPRSKSGTRERAQSSILSTCTDSGINETSLFAGGCNSSDGSDLIHNHSDTCLQMNECLENSVEFIENATESIISLNSTSISCKLKNSDSKESSVEFITPEEFQCTNAQDASDFNEAMSARSSSRNTNEGDGAEFQTPLENHSANSILTEDMSDEPIPSPSKWYLVREEETNFDPCAEPSHSGGVGSNLKQIFPIICSLPNLSTITEISKENDSLKPLQKDGNDKPTRTSNNFNSIFNIE